MLLDVSSGPGVRARLRKLRRVGPTAIPVGLALRRLYAQDEQPHLDRLGVKVVRVPTLNGPEARAVLAGADVAVSLDNALISEATFSAPARGTINVHHGSVPDYRGGPPVFWELADGRDTVGFTVPLVVRLEGTNVEIALKMLADSGRVITVPSLTI